jgi:hypothetical protein
MERGCTTETSAIDVPWGRNESVHENVPTCLSTGCGAVQDGARAGGETGEAAERWLKGRGNARPVHSTAQNPFQNVVAQRDLCGQGGAWHTVFCV